MKTTYNLDQMALFSAIAAAVGKQAPGLPADNRANVVIEAANMIVAAYALTDAEYMAKKAEAPIAVDLQPTAEQVEAGIASLWDTIPGAMDQLCQDVAEEEQGDLFSDAVTFVWQAMIGKRPQ
ncbi:hypothetical protein sortregn_36 [Escherichia phage sortregn]|nr:hypothetical protein sortregn_36 [Escherichia phage sortregn]